MFWVYLQIERLLKLELSMIIGNFCVGFISSALEYLKGISD